MTYAIFAFWKRPEINTIQMVFAVVSNERMVTADIEVVDLLCFPRTHTSTGPLHSAGRGQLSGQEFQRLYNDQSFNFSSIASTATAVYKFPFADSFSVEPE